MIGEESPLVQDTVRRVNLKSPQFPVFKWIQLFYTFRYEAGKPDVFSSIGCLATSTLPGFEPYPVIHGPGSSEQGLGWASGTGHPPPGHVHLWRDVRLTVWTLVQRCSKYPGKDNTMRYKGSR